MSIRRIGWSLAAAVAGVLAADTLAVLVYLIGVFREPIGASLLPSLALSIALGPSALAVALPLGLASTVTAPSGIRNGIIVLLASVGGALVGTFATRQSLHVSSTLAAVVSSISYGAVAVVVLVFVKRKEERAG